MYLNMHKLTTKFWEKIHLEWSKLLPKLFDELQYSPQTEISSIPFPLIVHTMVHYVQFWIPIFHENHMTSHSGNPHNFFQVSFDTINCLARSDFSGDDQTRFLAVK